VVAVHPQLLSAELIIKLDLPPVNRPANTVLLALVTKSKTSPDVQALMSPLEVNEAATVAIAADGLDDV
jgi:hypothetical protein